MNFEEYMSEVIQNCEDEIGKNILYIDKMNRNKLLYLSKAVDRTESIKKIYKKMHNLHISCELEKGVFEYTLVYSSEKKLNNNIMLNIYYDKINSIILNLNESYNPYLFNSLVKGETDPMSVAFLKPQEIHPVRWDRLIKKQALRKYKEENMAATDEYKCRHCGERKCKVTQMQTRSADEPMTTFVACLVCHKTFKFNQ